MLRHGQVKLADLIPLRKIGIEVLFAIPFGELRNLALQSQGGFQGQPKRLAVHDRQSARQPQAYWTGVGIGSIPEMGRATAKQLRFRGQLDVYFESNDRLAMFGQGSC